MAILGGSDWFQSKTSGETAPTVDSLMQAKKRPVAKAQAPAAPVTFSLDELMKTQTAPSGGAATATSQPQLQQNLAQGSAQDATPASDTTPVQNTAWAYNFPETIADSQASKDVTQDNFNKWVEGQDLFKRLTTPPDKLLEEYKAYKASQFSPTMVTQKDENGNPVVTGYYDYYGKWVTTEDWSDVNKAKTTYEDYINDPTKTPTADYSQPRQELQDLLTKWQDPNYLQNLEQEGLNWVDTFLGMAPGGFQAEQANLRGRLGAGIEGQAGLDPQTRARMERDVALQMQSAREETAQIMSQLQASGRGVQFFKQSEQIAAGLSSSASKGYMAIEDANYARQVAQYQALSDQWGRLYEQGSMSMNQFLQATQMQAQNTLATIGSEIAAISEQFQADQGAWSAYADALYKDVMINMQYHGLVSETEANDYEQSMAPYYADLQRRATEAQEKANETDIWDILGLITTGVSLIAAIPTGGASLAAGGAVTGALKGIGG